MPGPRPPLPHNSYPSATLPAPPARRDHTSTRPYACGPFHPHVNPMTCTWALQPARSPDRWWPGPLPAHAGPIDAHVNPTGGGLDRPPTMPPIGFSCALKGSSYQQTGPAASTATTTDTTAPKTQTTSPTTPDCQRFSPRWSALWAPHHLKPRRHRLQTGEMASLEPRHAGDTPTASL